MDTTFGASATKCSPTYMYSAVISSPQFTNNNHLINTDHYKSMLSNDVTFLEDMNREHYSLPSMLDQFSYQGHDLGEQPLVRDYNNDYEYIPQSYQPEEVYRPSNSMNQSFFLNHGHIEQPMDDCTDYRQYSVTIEGNHSQGNSRTSSQITVSGPNNEKRSRKPRTVFNTKQIESLLEHYKERKYLSMPERAKLATNLGLTQNQVKIWFQNRRSKEKKSPKDPNHDESNGTIKTEIEMGSQIQEMDGYTENLKTPKPIQNNTITTQNWTNQVADLNVTNRKPKKSEIIYINSDPSSIDKQLLNVNKYYCE